jgi:hypothetical protein
MNEGIRLKVEGRREYVSFEMGFGIILPQKSRQNLKNFNSFSILSHFS